SWFRTRVSGDGRVRSWVRKGGGEDPDRHFDGLADIASADGSDPPHPGQVREGEVPVVDANRVVVERGRLVGLDARRVAQLDADGRWVGWHGLVILVANEPGEPKVDPVADALDQRRGAARCECHLLRQLL